MSSSASQQPAAKSNNTKTKKPKQKNKVQLGKKRRKQSIIDKEKNLRREKYKQLIRMKGLHHAAKWKRILSACQFWFSETNLRNDEFMRRTLRKHHGWIPIKTLLTFPKFHHWTDAELLIKAFESSLGVKNFRLAYSQDLCRSPQKYNAQMLTDWEEDDDFLIQSYAYDDERLSVDCELDYMEGENAFGENESYEDTSDEEEDLSVEEIYDSDEGKSKAQKHDPATYDWGEVDDDDDELLQPNATRNVERIKVEEAPKPQEQHLKFLMVEDDHNDSPEVALVRHQKITLEYLDLLEQQLHQELEDKERIPANPVKPNTKKKKSPSLPKYISNRPVVVVRKPSQLKSFCEQLLASTTSFAKKSKDPGTARCIGFDAEYCTLEEDIRGNLPALIQLASPAPDGPVGLVWIDKFPNHGRNVMTDVSCKPLQDILGDSTLWKVGVAASGDARNLAAWFGARNTVHIFSGIGDLEAPTSVDGLSGLCENVLGKKLPKMKEKNPKAQRDRRKKGKRVPTAHWRREGMTPLMKEYAANDAACSVDIWLKLNDL